MRWRKCWIDPIVGDALIDPDFVARVRCLREHPNIDRIWVTTNAILLDKHGIDAVLDSGLTSITISTAGFEKEMYRRVYRNASYERMRTNVTELVRKNAERAQPLWISIALRPDRPLEHVMRDPDFQPILARKPALDFTWAYTSANGRIRREHLPTTMRLRVVSRRCEPCVSLYNGPIVLPDGTVMACSCVAAMDAVPDLAIGNVLERSLLELWRSERLANIRRGFGTKDLNKTCAGCDMYRDLELYRTRSGRQRGLINLERDAGRLVRRRAADSPFSGG